MRNQLLEVQFYSIIKLQGFYSLLGYLKSWTRVILCKSSWLLFLLLFISGSIHSLLQKRVRGARTKYQRSVEGVAVGWKGMPYLFQALWVCTLKTFSNFYYHLDSICALNCQIICFCHFNVQYTFHLRFLASTGNKLIPLHIFCANLFGFFFFKQQDQWNESKHLFLKLIIKIIFTRLHYICLNILRVCGRSNKMSARTQ